VVLPCMYVCTVMNDVCGAVWLICSAKQILLVEESPGWWVGAAGKAMLFRLGRAATPSTGWAWCGKKNSVQGRRETLRSTSREFAARLPNAIVRAGD
jgi:hypothetical protein